MLPLFLGGGVPLLRSRRLEIVAIVIVGRLGEIGVLLLAEDARLHVVELLLQLVHLRLVRLDVLPRQRLLRPQLVQLVPVDGALRLLQRRLRHFVLELRKLALRVLPLPVVVVPDHPDDRQEQEDA